MALGCSSRKVILAAVCSAILLSGCANNTASNPSNYGQRSNDVEAVDATIEREAERALARADARLGEIGRAHV